MYKYDRYLKSISEVETIYAIEWLIDVYTDPGGFQSVGWYQRFILCGNSIDSLPCHRIITSSVNG